MFKERLEKVIEDIQSENKNLQKFPSLLEVCEPGKTNFIPKRIGDSGYLLLCPFKVAFRKRVIDVKEQNPTDYMGVSPFMMVVMESGSKSYSPGDVVHLEPNAFQNMDRRFLIIHGAIGYIMPDGDVIGIDGDITEKVKASNFINTQADA
jgi:hypothetical protein